MSAPARPQNYSIDEAAELLGVGRSSVYVLINTGRLRTLRIGRRRIVTADAVRECVAALEREQRAQERSGRVA